MANRIYIAIGLIAILILGGAFIVPWFIDWNAYKPRMEQMASEALGVEVAIAGDMDFVLLPQPRMYLEAVRIGPEEEPVGSAQVVEADFSLLDFLRDRFTVTELRLMGPEVSLVVDETGQLQTPLTLAETALASNVSIANARFEAGSIALEDLRSGERWQADAFSGSMQLTALRGPFVVQGQASYDGAAYNVRVATSAMNADGAMQLAGQLRPAAGGFSASVDGLLETGAAPRYAGQLTYRQFARAQGDQVVGDLLLQSPIAADAEGIELSEFTLLPDETQVATRLTGNAAISLGAEMRFDASVSGGVVTMLPPQIAQDDAPQPYEIIGLLRDMPEPLIPPMPGRLAMSVNELGVRGVQVRDVRLDAETDGEVWSIGEFSGRLAGDTTLKLTGTLGRSAGWPAFEGTLAVAASRLDALALLWKRAGEGNPLFGMSGSLNGQVQLVNDRARLVEGVVVLDDTTHALAAEMRFGDAPSLAVDAEIAALDREQTQALRALLPTLDPSRAFGLSFPQGSINLGVEGAEWAGQALDGLQLAARWTGEGIVFDALSVGAFGGVGFNGAAKLAGTLEAPVVSGQGQMTLARGASAMSLLLGPQDGQNPLRAAILGSLPANLDVLLNEPGPGGSQVAELSGIAGLAEVDLRLEMTGGLMGLGQEQLGATLSLAADSGEALLAQLGAPPIILAPDGAIADARIFGNPRGALETQISIEGGGESVGFDGTINVSDPDAINGEGRVSFLFEQGSGPASLAGATGLWFPALEGSADLGIVGGNSVRLSNIAAQMGERTATGALNYTAQQNAALVSGSLAFDALDVDTLGAMLGGPAALIEGAPGVWPEGPIDLGAAPRQTRGRISVTAPALMAGDERLVEALAFDYAWGNEDAGLRGLFGEIGGGTVQLDATLCCSSTLQSKSLMGRITLNDVAIDAIVPQASAGALEGRLTLAAQVQGSGESFRQLAGSLNGEGSFTVEDLDIAKLSPSAFNAAADVDNLVEVEPEALETLVATALDSGPFSAEEAGSLISIVGGSARVSNFAIEGDGARLLGGGAIELDTLGIGGQWTLALTRILAGNGLITENTGRINVGVSGTLFAPERDLDLGPMVDAIQMRAYEIELDELEALRAQQEARQQEAAEEQARLMEEQARRDAERLLLEQQQLETQSEETQQLLDGIGNLLRDEGALDVPATTVEPFSGDEPDGAGEPAPGQAPDTPSFTILPPGALELDAL